MDFKFTDVRSPLTSQSRSFYRQSVRLGAKPLETHDQDFYFPIEHFRLWSLRNILSHKRSGLLFTTDAGPRQRSHSQVRLTRDPLPYFSVSDTRFPQTGGPGLRIYISQKQGDPVVPQGIGFPFRRLLRLAGPRWSIRTPLFVT
jgi:hypothetical protein